MEHWPEMASTCNPFFDVFRGLRKGILGKNELREKKLGVKQLKAAGLFKYM